MDSPPFPRRPPRLDLVFPRYFSPVYFVTFCTYRRRRILASQTVHSAFVVFARQGGAAYGVHVGRYVIMPDHVHLFVTGGPEFRLGNWMRLLKQSLGKALRDVSPSASLTGVGSEPKAAKRPSRIWQEGFFDHLLRNEESLAQKWDYVRENPVRAGLVSVSDDWPYQGEIAVIDRV